MKNMSSSEGMQGKSKTEGETPVQTNLGEQNSWMLFIRCFCSLIFSCVLFSS
jgi:hypothetical protein